MRLFNPMLLASLLLIDRSFAPAVPSPSRDLHPKGRQVMQADTVKEKRPRSVQRKRQVAKEPLISRASVPGSERTPVRFIKASLPPSDARVSTASLSAEASWDCNGDGVIDPMERALGRLYMTVDGDVGLHKMDLLSQRMKQQESAKPPSARAFRR